jgi:hypothetical protein
MSDETGMVVVEARQPVELGTLNAGSAPELISAASAIAKTLADVIDQQGLFVRIGGRSHVMVEGWTTLATMLGCTPREVSNVAHEDGSYVATVELVRMRDGAVISRATSECGMDEPTWAGRPRYARRSMAATRATGKACRLAFSWIIVLAGYAPTPAEEMPAERDVAPPAPRLQKPVDSHGAPVGGPVSNDKLATEKQRKFIWAKTMEAAGRLGIDQATAEAGLRKILADLDIESTARIPFKAVDTIKRAIEAWTLETFAGEPPEAPPESLDDAQIPF